MNELENKLKKHSIYFEEEKHEYNLNDKKLVPVTKILDYLKPKFDSEVQAKRCSENQNYYLFGKTKEEILQVWDNQNAQACERGHLFHLFAEKVVKNENFDDVLVDDRLKQSFLKFWGIVKELGINQIITEQKLAMPIFDIAGTFDLLVNFEKYGLFIFDWKTNQEFTTYSDFNLLEPFDKFDKSKLTLYTFQIYIYKYILEQEYNIEVKGERIIWLNELKGVVSHKPKFKYDINLIEDVIKTCSERYYGQKNY
jgi:hypothetical protein